MKGALILEREVRFIKPNMHNLKGKTGRIILEQLRNAKTDHSKLEETVKKAKAEILAKRMDEQ